MRIIIVPCKSAISCFMGEGGGTEVRASRPKMANGED